MRIALATRPVALWGAVAIVALVLLLPLRLVLGAAGIGDEGLSARAVTGSVWAGRLHEAAIGEAALGDLDARLSPWGLLMGEARLRLDGVGDVRGDARGGAPGGGVHGTVVSGRHLLGLTGADAAVDVGTLLAPLPVRTVTLEGVTVRFRDERCDMAEGRVRASLGGSAVGGVALPATLSGTIRCDGAALLVPLASVGGGEAVAMRIEAGGRYRADFTLQPSDAATATRLAAAGFLPAAGGWRLSVEGRL